VIDDSITADAVTICIAVPGRAAGRDRPRPAAGASRAARRPILAERVTQEVNLSAGRRPVRATTAVWRRRPNSPNGEIVDGGVIHRRSGRREHRALISRASPARVRSTRRRRVALTQRDTDAGASAAERLRPTPSGRPCRRRRVNYAKVINEALILSTASIARTA
jgi:hypothetical protein